MNRFFILIVLVLLISLTFGCTTKVTGNYNVRQLQGIESECVRPLYPNESSWSPSPDGSVWHSYNNWDIVVYCKRDIIFGVKCK